jgi:hypothetical protein
VVVGMLLVVLIARAWTWWCELATHGGTSNNNHQQATTASEEKNIFLRLNFENLLNLSQIGWAIYQRMYTV